MDPDPHGSAFIFPPGSGSRRKILKKKSIEKGNPSGRKLWCITFFWLAIKKQKNECTHNLYISKISNM